MWVAINIPESAKQAFDKAAERDVRGGYYDQGGVIGQAIKNGVPLPHDSEQLLEKVAALEAENKTLRTKLENAEDVLRELKEDLEDARAELESTTLF